MKRIIQRILTESRVLKLIQLKKLPFHQNYVLSGVLFTRNELSDSEITS